MKAVRGTKAEVARMFCGYEDLLTPIPPWSRVSVSSRPSARLEEHPATSSVCRTRRRFSFTPGSEAAGTATPLGETRRRSGRGSALDALVMGVRRSTPSWSSIAGARAQAEIVIGRGDDPPGT